MGSQGRPDAAAMHEAVIELAVQGVSAEDITVKTGANIHTVRVLMRRCGALPRGIPAELRAS